MDVRLSPEQRMVKELTARVTAAHDNEARRDLAWAMVETEMLRAHVCRRLSERLDGIAHGSEGSIDKSLMTTTEQTVGHAALALPSSDDGGDTSLKTYLYSRAQSVVGGTSQIQRNLVATRILGLPNA